MWPPIGTHYHRQKPPCKDSHICRRVINLVCTSKMVHAHMGTASHLHGSHQFTWHQHRGDFTCRAESALRALSVTQSVRSAVWRAKVASPHAHRRTPTCAIHIRGLEKKDLRKKFSRGCWPENLAAFENKLLLFSFFYRCFDVDLLVARTQCSGQCSEVIYLWL